MRQRLPGDEACLDLAHVMLIEEVYIYHKCNIYVYDVMFLELYHLTHACNAYVLMRMTKMEFGVFIQMPLCSFLH